MITRHYDRTAGAYRVRVIADSRFSTVDVLVSRNARIIGVSVYPCDRLEYALGIAEEQAAHYAATLYNPYTED